MYVCIICSVVSGILRPHRLQLSRFLCLWYFPGKNTGMGCHSLLQGIFPTQGLNPGLLHCKQFLYCLNHQGISKCKLGNRTLRIGRIFIHRSVILQLQNELQIYFLQLPFMACYVIVYFFPISCQHQHVHIRDATKIRHLLSVHNQGWESHCVTICFL